MAIISKAGAHRILRTIYTFDDPFGSLIRIICLTILITTLLLFLPTWFEVNTPRLAFGRLVNFALVIAMLGGGYGLIYYCVGGTKFPKQREDPAEERVDRVVILYFALGLLIWGAALSGYNFTHTVLHRPVTSILWWNICLILTFVSLPVFWLLGINRYERGHNSSLFKLIRERPFEHTFWPVLGGGLYAWAISITYPPPPMNLEEVLLLLDNFLCGFLNLLMIIIARNLLREARRTASPDSLVTLRPFSLLIGWTGITCAYLLILLANLLPPWHFFSFYEGSPTYYLFSVCVAALTVSLTYWIYPLSRQQTAAERNGHPLFNDLTPAEQYLVRLIAAGYSNKEIAARLDRSIKTIDRHVRDLFLRTSFQNRRDLQGYYRAEIETLGTLPNGEKAD